MLVLHMYGYITRKYHHVTLEILRCLGFYAISLSKKIVSIHLQACNAKSYFIIRSQYRISDKCLVLHYLSHRHKFQYCYSLRPCQNFVPLCAAVYYDLAAITR